MKAKRIVVAALVAAALVLTGPAAAEVITLTDGNSTLQIDPESSLGVFGWSIGDVSKLHQQWFWFRNNLDDYDDQEYSIDQISPPAVFQHPSVPNLAILTYTDAQGRFSVQVTYMLTGGAGLLTCDLMENVKVTNLSAETLTFDIFQYSDFDLGVDGDDASVRITGGNTAVQTGYGGAMITLSETVTTGAPDLSETGIYSATLDKLMDGNVNDLDGSTLANGPANLTWAFQWADRRIAPGQAFIISKDKLLTMEPIAEPASLGLFGIALLALRKRRS
ncbi:MAG: hypothetical protein ABIF82_07930 [Planctomycetota bacterium]